jgi:glutamyl-tRNA synthetase
MTVRVRFAPSPTGSLHIGSVRTALYNYLFARQSKGSLILRIEDTDQDRLVPGAIESIYKGFDWVGVRFDEGPREGGTHAPYIQSERLPLYQKHAQELVDGGAAYFCFCSKERLASLRAQQAARKEITRYDGLCRRIDPKDAAERAKNEPHVVRLKVPDDGVVAVDDLVYGHIEWPLNTIEDQVLLKSDGFPTYHLAVVVDDHVMGITHIFRGEDWLPSTPKHLLIWRAFGWEIPPHAHVPNVLGPDGKKLAKRHGATKVEEFKTQGYLPEALINYLALVGWSPGTEEEIFSMDDLIARWRMDQVHRAGGKWDKARLDWFNGMWIRKLGEDDLLGRLAGFLPPEWDREVLRKTLPVLRERMATLVEARDQLEFLFAEPPHYDAKLLVPKKKEPQETFDVLVKSTILLGHVEPFDHAAIRAAIEGIAAEMGWSLKDTSHPIRVAITGRTVGLPLFESLELLGRERALARIERAQDLLEKGVD